MRDKARYAFVVPRYWPGMAGGAETLAGELAQKLSDRGDNVEVLTTCAKDNRSWANEFPAGAERSRDLIISRYPVDHRDLEKWIPLQIAISQGLVLSPEDELTWMEQSVNSSALYQTLLRRKNDFDLFFFAPYLFGTTFWGSLLHPEKSCLIPCLHDEHYAYTEVIQSMFRQVRGAIFNALPEQELANRLYGEIRGAEVGMGFDFEQYQGSHSRFFAEEFPYLLYVGRKETGKSVDLLVDYFIQGKDSNAIPAALKLVVVGGGSFSDLHRPQALLRDDIIDVAHVSEGQKLSLMCHALLLAQPSLNESFSIVLMESWLLGTPVLVPTKCAVTADHVIASGGGLYYADYNDFIGALVRIFDDRNLALAMGLAGGRYVRSRYNWKAVLARFDSAVEKILLSNSAGGGCTERIRAGLND